MTNCYNLNDLSFRWQDGITPKKVLEHYGHTREEQQGWICTGYWPYEEGVDHLTETLQLERGYIESHFREIRIVLEHDPDFPLALFHIEPARFTAVAPDEVRT